MKIILAALNAKYVHSNLAVYDIEAYTKKRCPEQKKEIIVKEYTINHNLDLILQDLYQEKAEVYAFACYIWNIYEILTITRELKKVLTETKIWLGGPEVSYDGKNYLEKHPCLEGIILGEGEVTFYELTRVWCNSTAVDENDWNYGTVAGIIYRDESGMIFQTNKRPLMDLNELPFVYDDLSRFQNKIIYYESSRGCPFQCSYCLSSIEKKVRFRNLTLVKKELDFFLEQKVPQVKFVDRTFNCNKEHAREIWKYITEHDNGVTNFHFEVAADLIGTEEFIIFKKMRPGLIQLEIGLQSTNPKTIREIRRVMDIEKVKKTLLTIRGFQNIHQHLDLIAGLPFEDFTSFKKSFNDAYAMKPNQLQLGFLKVLTGSYMGEQVENYALKYRDVQPYEVLSTKWISYDEILILKKVEEMVEVYYNSDQYGHVLPYAISFFKSPYQFYEALGFFYQERDLFGIGFKREARYIAFRDFCYSCLKDVEDFSLSILDNLLTFDYYLRENIKNRPSWAKKEPIKKEVYQAFFRNGGTDEVSLSREGYDSKMAARMMHIEPIEPEAFFYIQKSEEKSENKMQNNVIYCLFNYEKRNPLSKDAEVIFLSHL